MNSLSNSILESYKFNIVNNLDNLNLYELYDKLNPIYNSMQDEDVKYYLISCSDSNYKLIIKSIMSNAINYCKIRTNRSGDKLSYKVDKPASFYDFLKYASIDQIERFQYKKIVKYLLLLKDSIINRGFNPNKLNYKKKLIQGSLLDYL